MVAEAPDQIDSALVIPAGAEITLSLVRLHPFLEERIAAVFPLSMVHAHSHALMDSQASLNLSAEELDTWLNRYALGKTIEVPSLAGLAGWVSLRTLRGQQCDDDRALEAALRLQATMLVSDEAFVDDSDIALLLIHRDHCRKTCRLAGNPCSYIASATHWANNGQQASALLGRVLVILNISIAGAADWRVGLMTSLKQTATISA